MNNYFNASPYIQNEESGKIVEKCINIIFNYVRKLGLNEEEEIFVTLSLESLLRASLIAAADDILDADSLIEQSDKIVKEQIGLMLSNLKN